jgi:glucosamine-6-phosphate isomerase
MITKVFPDYDALSKQTADELIDLIKQKPNAVICFASGSTPVGTCEWLVKKIKEQQIDVSKITFIGLDEWVGIPKENKGSCYYFQYHYLFTPLQLQSSQIVLFDGMAKNLEGQCMQMDATIEQKGGIDLMIVGIGMNGHIGFNEPGVDFNLLSHVINLDDTTKTVGQKYFTETIALSQGITLGLGHLMQTKKVILQANGIKKANIIKQAHEPVTVNGLSQRDPFGTKLPASILQTHPNSFIYVDADAGSLL